MKNEITKRIELLISLSGLSIRAFAHNIDSSEQTLYKCIGGRIPNIDILQKILLAYPDISAEWLLMGNCDMKKQNIEMLKEQIRVKDEQINRLIDKIK